MIFGRLHNSFSIQVGDRQLILPSVQEIQGYFPRRVHFHEVGMPHDSLTIPGTAELEISLCSFSPPLSVDPVQFSLAHFGVDYLKQKEKLLAFCILLFHPKS